MKYLVIAVLIILSGCQTNTVLNDTHSFTLVQHVYDWGSSYSEIQLDTSSTDTNLLDASMYTVNVKRETSDGSVLDEGTREVIGVEQIDGGIQLTLQVSPDNELAQPYYTKSNGYKDWAICHYEIQNGDYIWNEQKEVLHPDEEMFQSGTYNDLKYAYYEPDTTDNKPLIIWFHGYGSGGDDLGFVTGGMNVKMFVQPEIQEYFGGAYILMPQSPTNWLDAGNGQFVSSDKEDIYTDALNELIDDFIQTHSIDVNRIYVGGCSAGGYRTIKTYLSNPSLYAAVFPVCPAYNELWITEEDKQLLMEVPLWFIHCKDDPQVNPNHTSLPIYESLKQKGKEDVHYTMYEKIVDEKTGYIYNNHNSWIYVLQNKPEIELNGKTITLFEWLSNQSR